ncbi:MAG: 16S rRNA (guanine(527)-N(7))-methyltransferase RsmG [Spirochaetes bacterium]|nr:16S rRNA (guanine(527)-N(7))-methyltransferase RsmG [Spirochaetota bacterium]
MYEDKIRKYLQKSSLYLNELSITQLSLYLKLLTEYNASHDLTRIKNIDEIILKHFIDSLYITSIIHIPSPLLDIGTGAGFPGIPLAIAQPESHIILAESRHKRVEFLSIVKNELNLDNVEIYSHLVTERSFFEVNGVITRAVESIKETMQRCSHFLKKENQIIFMKGPSVDEEIIDNDEHYRLILNQQYVLPDTSYQRRLIVYEKLTNTIKKIYYISKQGTSQDGTAITSNENKRFKEFKRIASDPKKYNSTFVPGKKIIQELIISKPELCKYLILYDEYIELDSNFMQCIAQFGPERTIILKKSLFNEIDITEANQPMMLVQVPPINQWEGTCQELSLMLPFQDPVNMGAAIRSAVAFGVRHIIVCQNAVYPFHPKSIRASAGAVFYCIIEKGPSLDILNSKEIPCPLITLDMKGEDIHNFNFPQKAVLLAGIEGPGLPDIKKSLKVRIPINTVESLNATVAVSIALYEWHKQKKK